MLLVKSTGGNFFRAKLNLEEELTDFIKESITKENVVNKLEYILSNKKINKFDVYDLIRTVRNLSKDIPQEKSVYTAVIKTSEGMNASFETIIDSIFYYSGIISDFKTRGIDIAKLGVKEFNSESVSKIKNLNNDLEDNLKQIKLLQDSNRSIQREISETKTRDTEYAKNMLQIVSYFDTISTKKIQELKDERQKCLKFLK